jgi:hypothetical protein
MLVVVNLPTKGCLGGQQKEIGMGTQREGRWNSYSFFSATNRLRKSRKNALSLTLVSRSL